MRKSSPLEVIPLGVGNFFSARRYCTSMLLCAGGRMVLIDCPEPFFRICADASRKSGRAIDPAQIDHIVLTHLHGDHCHGLEGLAFWKKFHGGRKRKPIIYTSFAVAKVLWKKLSVSMGRARMPSAGMDERYELKDYFELRGFNFGDTISVCGIQIQTRRTLHSLPCFGLRATYKGRKFGYSCDTSFDPHLIDFLAPCDLIFHETDAGLHTPLEKLESLPLQLRRKMRLVHVNDQFRGSRLIRTAHEGRVYRV